MPSVIQASSLFQQHAQDWQVEDMLQEVQSFKHHTDLSGMVDTINKIDVQQLSPQGKERFQTLCGRVHQYKIDEYVHAIHDEAIDLDKGNYTSPEELAKRAHTLRLALADIWDSHTGFSDENKQFLDSATAVLHKLSSKTDDVVIMDRAPKIEPSQDFDEASEKLELMSIAQLVYEGKMEEALMNFRQLPPSLQERFGGAKALDDREAFVQSAFTYASGGQSLPFEEIIRMFNEAEAYS